MVRKVDLERWNVYGVEDPIEILVADMTQIAVNDKADMTFAEATRAEVRQDPDLVMIGELRDLETVRECIAFSTTGQRLWSTTHARSALHIVNRLTRLGATRADVADTLTMGISQRLLGKLCEYCQEPNPNGLSDAAKRVIAEDKILSPALESAKILKTKGCAHCNGTGYRGRFGVIEYFEVTPAVQELIKSDSASLLDIARVAAKSGYRPMILDGLRHVLAGETSEEELLRQLAYEDMLV
jgi:type II secretory ATPase GspE/PulE/Tfp pilus assembly ATPase PilB-like protein